MKKLLLILLIHTTSLMVVHGQCTDPVWVIDENFTGLGVNTPPDCWTVTGNVLSYVFNNGDARFGGQNNTLISPRVENTTGVVTFKATHNNSRTYRGLTIDIGVTSNGTDFTKIGTIDYGQAGFKNYSFDFSSHNGSGSYIAFKGNSSSGQTFVLDDFHYQSTCANSTSATAKAKDITVKLDATGNIIVNPSQVDNGSVKSCQAPITNLSLDKTLFTCEDLGENTVTLTVNDDNGHTATATAVITVEPTMAIATNRVYLDKDGQFKFTIENGLSSSTTKCSEITYSFSKTDIECTDVGTESITLTATYAGGTSTTSRNISIVDDIAPVAIAKDISVTIDKTTGLATITPQMMEAGSTDNCGIASTALSKTIFGCGDQGENVVEFTVTDNSGHTNKTTAKVTVNSFIPDVNVSADNSSICFDGESTSSANITTDGSMVGAKYSLRKASDSTIVDGPIDGTGNALSFSTGTVNKNTTYHVYAEVPAAGKALSLPSSSSYVSINTPSSFDYSKGYTVSTWVKERLGGISNSFDPIFYAGGATGSDIEIYLNSITGALTLVHNRDNGGTNSHFVTTNNLLPDNQYAHLAVAYDGATAKIFVNGVEKKSGVLAAPVKSASSEMTFGFLNNTAFPGRQNFEGQLDDIRIYDIARASSAITEDMNRCLAGTESNLALYFDLESIDGTILTDKVSNTPAQLKNGGSLVDDFAISCTFNCNRIMSNEIIVGDNVAPTIIAKNITVKHDGTGSTNVNPADLNNGSSDNCTVNENLTYSLDKSIFNCDDLGSQQVVLTVRDEAGNVATANATITLTQFTPDEQVTAAATEVCPGESTTINIASSQTDVSYFLRDSENNTIAGPIVGTGEAIEFNTGIINETTVYNVHAESNLKNAAYKMSGGHLRIANSSSLQLSGNWTLETWIKPLAGFRDYYLIESYDANGGFVLRANANGKFQAYAMNTSSNSSTLISTSSYVNNEWIHVAATFDETTNELKIYINGILNAANNSATIDQRGPKTTIKLGARGDDSKASGNHEQDEIRIWNVARTPQQINENKSKSLTGTESGLVAYYNFNKLSYEADGMKIPDLTSNANESEIVGGYTEANFTDDAIYQSQSCTLQMSNSVTVNGGDEVKPTVITQDFTLVLGDKTSATISTDDINNGSNDNCTSADNLTLSLDVTSFDNTQLGEHTVTLTVTDANGNSDTGSAKVTVTDKTPQSVTFEAITDKVFGDADFELTASASTNLPIVYSVLSGPVSISGSTVSITGAGQATIRASQAGDDTYAPAQVDRTFTIAKADQSLTVEEVTNKTVAATPITINASINTNLNLTYEITGPATISNNIVTLNGTVGTISVTVSQAGTDNYNAASKTITFEVVAQSLQTITFATIEAKTYGVEAFDLAPTSDSELPVTVTLISGPATISGSTITITGVGEVVLEATQTGDVTFAAADPVRQNFVVNKAPLTITAEDKAITFGDDLPTLTINYAGFVNSETESVLTTIPSISTTAGTGDNAGTYSIDLTGGEAANYEITLVNGTLTIAKVIAEITITDLEHIEDGTAKTPTIVITPADLKFNVTYNGSTDAPSAIGSYQVVVTIDELNYEGSKEVTLNINAILGIEDEVAASFNVYPNPAVNILKIDSKLQASGKVVLYNIRGIKVLAHNLESFENQIDVSTLPTGLYILSIMDEKAAIIKKQMIRIND